MFQLAIQLIVYSLISEGVVSMLHLTRLESLKSVKFWAIYLIIALPVGFLIDALI